MTTNTLAVETLKKELIVKRNNHTEGLASIRTAESALQNLKQLTEGYSQQVWQLEEAIKLLGGVV